MSNRCCSCTPGFSGRRGGDALLLLSNLLLLMVLRLHDCGLNLLRGLYLQVLLSNDGSLVMSLLDLRGSRHLSGRQRNNRP